MKREPVAPPETERDMIMVMSQQLIELRDDVWEIKDIQHGQNSQLADIKTEQHRQDGALSVLWKILGVSLAGLGVGATVAGVVLTLLLKGGG